MPKIAQAFIFSAGFGTRLYEISTQLPKPLINFSGKALIDWAVQNFLNHGLKKIGINLHYCSKIIKDYVLDKYPNLIIFEEEELLSTGGALLSAYPILMKQSSVDDVNQEYNNYIFTTNVDAVWNKKEVLSRLEYEFFRLIKNNHKIDILMLFSKINDKIKRPSLSFEILENNQVIMDSNLPCMFTGVQIINLDLVLSYSQKMQNKKIFSLGEIYLDSKTQNGKLNNVYGLLCDDVYHVGTKEEFVLFENVLR